MNYDNLYNAKDSLTLISQELFRQERLAARQERGGVGSGEGRCGTLPKRLLEFR